MSDSDSDFGEVDFVSSASTVVNRKWSKQNLSDIRHSVESFDGLDVTTDLSSKMEDYCPPDSVQVNTKQKNSDIKVQVTPPSSPDAGKSNSNGKRPKVVRGAARTRKTTQALKKIEQKNQPVAVRSNRKPHSEPITFETLEPETQMDESIEIKVMFKTDITRLQVLRREKMGLVMDRFADKFNLKAGGIGFLYSEEHKENQEQWVSRDVTVESLNVNLFSILIARARDTAMPDDDYLIELKVQTKDRRSSVSIKICKMDKMKVLMSKFCDLKLLQLSSLRFFFDGEELCPDDTPESLDLEGGECIDVHQISSD